MSTITPRGILRWFAGAILPALVLAGCSTEQDAEPASPPKAPQQLLPPAANDAAIEETPIEDVPIDQLADPTWVEVAAADHDIPTRAMAAYAGAALRMNETDPECKMGWNTLAGVGEVETAHASHGGSGLDAEGVAEPAIYGPVLDGETGGMMAIEDTDEGELDGDEQWDRAVGPMQFLPETWERYAQDGNLDGQTDPQQIDDAVLTAAAYLCDNTEDLTADEQWVAAIVTYNQSMSYARAVAASATSFEPEGYAAATGPVGELE